VLAIGSAHAGLWLVDGGTTECVEGMGFDVLSRWGVARTRTRGRMRARKYSNFPYKLPIGKLSEIGVRTCPHVHIERRPGVRCGRAELTLPKAEQFRNRDSKTAFHSSASHSAPNSHAVTIPDTRV
jgi:hypothetical protein